MTPRLRASPSCERTMRAEAVSRVDCSLTQGGHCRLHTLLSTVVLIPKLLVVFLLVAGESAWSSSAFTPATITSPTLAGRSVISSTSARVSNDYTYAAADSPIPYITSPLPSSATADYAGFTPTVNASDLLPSSIRWPDPSVVSLYPSSAAASGAGFTLTVNGSRFQPGSTVEWNGSLGQPPLATTYVNASQLTVAIPASDIAFAGNANVTVVNPAPGFGKSRADTFTITGTLPGDVSFVAPNGNDSNPGTIGEPYLTIQKCASTISSGSTCAIRAGTYRETVTPNSGITITSYNGEPVTVDGSDPVTGWTLYQGSIYQASVALSSGDTNQVFVGNQMMTEARWPSGNDLFNVNWAIAETGTNDSQLVDSHLPNNGWTGAKVHLLSGSDPWNAQSATVTSSASGSLTMSLDDADFSPFIQPQAGGYYYLYRSIAALDQQGQWFYDSGQQLLYFWAPGGVDPNTLDVRAKRRQYAFDLSGQSNVNITNISLFGCGTNMNASSANNLLDGIDAQYLSHFTDFPAVAAGPTSYWYAHFMDSGIVMNGSGNILRNSTLAWSAGNGVSLMGSDNTVQNNLIVNTGYAGGSASGIYLFGTGHEVQNNTVHTSGRTSLTNFPYPVTPDNNDIGYNNFFNAMLLNVDGGEIYQGWTVTATRIHHNWLHDTQTPIPLSPGAPRAGMYIDEEAGGYEVDQNVLWNNEFYNIQLHGGAATPFNNYVHNNSIPDAAPNAYIYLQGVLDCGTTLIQDNLVLVPVNQDGTNPPCAAVDNGSTAPGATEMTSAVQVGCNFTGCSSEGPPAISGTSVAASVAVQPYNMTVTFGQPVTFTVTGAGSPPLTYQWQRDGTNITGATSATYTIPKTAAADNGQVFTVTVTNSLGSITSNPATLTVQDDSRGRDRLFP
jgi:hypothetical protein